MGFLSVLFGRTDKEPSLEFDEFADDLDDMVPEEPADPDFLLAGSRVGMQYRDERGLRTKRIVRLKRLDAGEYQSYIHGFCELRQEDRTFRIDRIATLFDPSTGEILPDAVEYFGPYIDRALDEEEREAERAKFGMAWKLIEALRHELSVLILVARADGRFAKSEQSMILRFATERAADMRIATSDTELALLAKWIKLQDPSEPEARISVKSLASREGVLADIFEVAEYIAEADGKIKDEERQSLLEIEKVIKSLAEG